MSAAHKLQEPAETADCRFHVEASYLVSARDVIELPEGKSWTDVRDFHVKYGTARIAFTDGTTFEHELETQDLGDIDWKWPVIVTVDPVDSNDEPRCQPIVDERSEIFLALPEIVKDRLRKLGYEVAFGRDEEADRLRWCWKLKQATILQGPIEITDEAAWVGALLHALETKPEAA